MCDLELPDGTAMELFHTLRRVAGMFQMKNPPVRLLPFFILTESNDQLFQMYLKANVDWKDCLSRYFIKNVGQPVSIWVSGSDMLRKLSHYKKGMQMKLMLACAFSYDAKLLILDEPTSGLDPVSRDELLKILSEYIEDGEHSVLFSTHITGDLERAADYITYISYGELYFTGSKDDFVDMFRIVKGGIEELSDDLKNKAAGIRTFPTGFEALMKTEDISGFPNLTVEPATIDEIVVFTSKKGDDYE